MHDVDLSSLHSELRGITDAVEDLQYDHLSKISSLISAAQGIVKQTEKSRPDQVHKHMDYWEVIEGSHELVRHHVKVRNSTFALNLLRSALPVDKSRLTDYAFQRWHLSDCHGSRLQDIDEVTSSN